MSENYPNSDPDRRFTLDAADQLAQIRAKKAKMLATQLVPNPANDARKNATDDGDKEVQDLEGEYSINIKPSKVGKASPTPVIEEEGEA